MESYNKPDSRLLKFDLSIHVKALTKKQEINSFEPQKNNSLEGDFEL